MEKDRIEQRTKALLRARLRDGDSDREIAIIDLSSRGLLMTTARPPIRGAFVEIMVGKHSLVGHVKWAGDRRFGVALRERVDVVGLIAGDSGPITLAARQVARTRARRRSFAWIGGSETLGRTMQWATLGVAGAAAAFLVADSVAYALGGVELAGKALEAANSHEHKG